MNTNDPDPIASPEAMIVKALPDGDRKLLRQGAVLRYITEDLARVVTGSDEEAKRLLKHPLVRGDSWGRQEPIWEISLPLRQALLEGWDRCAAKVLKRVAAAISSDDHLHSLLYARLASIEDRPQALQDLEEAAANALGSAEPDIGRANDLLRLLSAWPLDRDDDAREMRDEVLSPSISRYAQGERDRETSRTYLERAFEKRAVEFLFDKRPQWMLQIHAPGGRGKTSFLRNFVGRVCPRRGVPFARVDFDFITHIRIVTQEPWRILLTIARQLDRQLPSSPFKSLLEKYGDFQAMLISEALPISFDTGEIDDAWHKDIETLYAVSDVPRKFRSLLKSAVEDGYVVVVLDTLENVLHAEGADLGSLLIALKEINASVPGLRVILSGRFDLQSERSYATNVREARVQGFEETWVGLTTEEDLGDTSLRIGREVASIEVPVFSNEEAQLYLERICNLGSKGDDALLKAIVERCDGNPMKLALFAEQVLGEPPLTIEDVEAFESVDLFFLVDRVVDRITDEHVQWLLRWGVLPHLLTRSFAETVIWPALEAFAARQSTYDDPRKDNLPSSRHEIERWPIPDLDSIVRPGAALAAWTGLLDYAARSSWVSLATDLDDAVVFHGDVRDPLRRLLRKGQHPAYDDIHKRSLAYWTKRAENDDGRASVIAACGVMFHAYQPWHGDRPDAAIVANNLLRQFAANRKARGEIAAEILQAHRQAVDEQIDGPTSTEVTIAHLELGECLVHEALASGMPVDEVRLQAHVEAIKNEPGFRDGRRYQFIRAALSIATGDEKAGWESLRLAMKRPATDDVGGQSSAHIDLVAFWLSARTPPAMAFGSLDAIRHEAKGTSAEALVQASLSRGLLVEERWHEALEAARESGEKDLEAGALLGQGLAKQLLKSKDYPILRRAEAALLQYQPDFAIDLLAAEWETTTSQLLQARACIMRSEHDRAQSLLSSVMAGDDHAIAAQAALDFCRLLLDLGYIRKVDSQLRRLPENLPSSMAFLKTALEAVTAHHQKNEWRLTQTTKILRNAKHDPEVPPSALVEIELARLEIGDAIGLDELTEALARMDGVGSRMIALRGLSRVVGSSLPHDPPSRLVKLCTGPPLPSSMIEEPAMILGMIELLRVTGDVESARHSLRELAHISEESASSPSLLMKVIDEANERCQSEDFDGMLMTENEPIIEPFSSSKLDGTPDVALFVSSGHSHGTIHVKVDIPASNNPEFEHQYDLTSKTVADGVYALASHPDSLFEDLGRALGVEHFDQVLSVDRNDEMLGLWIEDEEAASLPWELATHHKEPLSRSGTIIRCSVTASGPQHSSTAIRSSSALVMVGIESKDRGHTLEQLSNIYASSTTIIASWNELATIKPKERVIHLVTEVATRRRGAGLLLRGEFVTAHNLAECLGDDIPRLLVLDLALPPYDVDAAEQLLLANSFCWTLSQAVPSLSIISGVFAAAHDHIPQLHELGRSLNAGSNLVELAGSLQRFKTNLPMRHDHPLRSSVALVSATPLQRFVLGSSQ